MGAFVGHTREPLPNGVPRSWAVPNAYWSTLAVLFTLATVLMAMYVTNGLRLALLLALIGLPVLQLGAALLVMLWVAFFPSPSYEREARSSTLSRIVVYGFIGAIIGAVLTFILFFVVLFLE